MSTLALVLIQLHGPDGTLIDINPHEVSSLISPSELPEGHMAKGTSCIVFMTNGRSNAVRENCEDVRRRVEDAK